MKRALVIASGADGSTRSFPLGAHCVAAAMPEGRCGVLDLGPAPGIDAEAALRSIESAIDGSGARAIGFSTYVWNRPLMAGLAARLRSHAPGLRLIAGGPEASADPEGLLAEAPFDACVAGEGETVFARLAESMEWPEGKRIIRAEEEDPAALASPWLRWQEGAEKLEGAPWETARGCPYACSYCYESLGARRVRKLPMERLGKELAAFAARGTRELFVLDPSFDLDRGRALDIIGLARKTLPEAHFSFECRGERIDGKLAQAFSRLNCSVQIGIQSVREGTLANLGRAMDKAALVAGVKRLERAGVVYGFDLMYGLPGDGLAEFLAALDFALGLRPNHLDLFRLSVLPGTALWRDGEGLGLRWGRQAPYEVESSREANPEELAEAARISAAVSLVYNEGRAVSWFLTALKPLRLRPSGFFKSIAASMAHGGRGDTIGSKAAEAFQLDVLQRLYRERGREGLYPALAELVRFNGAWGRALAEGEETELELRIGIEALMGSEAMDLEVLAQAQSPKRMRVLVRPGADGGVAVLRE